MKFKKVSIFVFVLIAALTSSEAFAALGSGSDSISKDSRYFRGSVRVSTKRAYRVHEIDSDGITIREYVAKNGVVFGVSWRGAGEPDLSQLFGSYYSEYRSAEPHARRLGRQAPLRIDSANITVEKSGHMRAIRGRAYVSALIPAGVTPEDIQ